MKHIKRINESNTCPSYEEALEIMCKFIAGEIQSDYMSGSMSPRYGGERGCIDTLSILYGVDRNKVRKRVDEIIEEYRVGKRKRK